MFHTSPREFHAFSSSCELVKLVPFVLLLLRSGKIDAFILLFLRIGKLDVF